MYGKKKRQNIKMIVNLMIYTLMFRIWNLKGSTKNAFDLSKKKVSANLWPAARELNHSFPLVWQINMA